MISRAAAAPGLSSAVVIATTVPTIATVATVVAASVSSLLAVLLVAFAQIVVRPLERNLVTGVLS